MTSFAKTKQPRWMFFYKGEDGKCYVKMEFEANISMPNDIEEANFVGEMIRKTINAKHFTTFQRLNRSICYVEIGSPNLREMDIK